MCDIIPFNDFWTMKFKLKQHLKWWQNRKHFFKKLTFTLKVLLLRSLCDFLSVFNIISLHYVINYFGDFFSFPSSCFSDVHLPHIFSWTAMPDRQLMWCGHLWQIPVFCQLSFHVELNITFYNKNITLYDTMPDYHFHILSEPENQN